MFLFLHVSVYSYFPIQRLADQLAHPCAGSGGGTIGSGPDEAGASEHPLEPRRDVS